MMLGDRPQTEADHSARLLNSVNAQNSPHMPEVGSLVRTFSSRTKGQNFGVLLEDTEDGPEGPMAVSIEKAEADAEDEIAAISLGLNVPTDSDLCLMFDGDEAAAAAAGGEAADADEAAAAAPAADAAESPTKRARARLGALSHGASFGKSFRGYEAVRAAIAQSIEAGHLHDNIKGAGGSSTVHLQVDPTLYSDENRVKRRALRKDADIVRIVDDVVAVTVAGTPDAAVVAAAAYVERALRLLLLLCPAALSCDSCHLASLLLLLLLLLLRPPRPAPPRLSSSKNSPPPLSPGTHASWAR